MRFLDLFVDVENGTDNGLQYVDLLLILLLLAIVDLDQSRLLVSRLFHDLLLARLLPFADLHVEHGQLHV